MPMIGEVTVGFASTHAIATVARATPSFSATTRTRSAISYSTSLPPMFSSFM
jgi:hypothetical protein